MYVHVYTMWSGFQMPARMEQAAGLSESLPIIANNWFQKKKLIAIMNAIIQVKTIIKTRIRNNCQ